MRVDGPTIRILACVDFCQHPVLSRWQSYTHFFVVWYNYRDVGWLSGFIWACTVHESRLSCFLRLFYI